MFINVGCAPEHCLSLQPSLYDRSLYNRVSTTVASTTDVITSPITKHFDVGTEDIPSRTTFANLGVHGAPYWVVHPKTVRERQGAGPKGGAHGAPNV